MQLIRASPDARGKTIVRLLFNVAQYILLFMIVYCIMMILAECREDHFKSIQRELNREIQLLQTREKIPMA